MSEVCMVDILREVGYVYYNSFVKLNTKRKTISFCNKFLTINYMICVCDNRAISFFITSKNLKELGLRLS